MQMTSLAQLHALLFSQASASAVQVSVDDNLHELFYIEFVDGRAVIVPCNGPAAWPTTVGDLVDFLHNEFFQHPATTPISVRGKDGQEWPLRRSLGHSMGGVVIVAEEGRSLSIAAQVKGLYVDAAVRQRIAQAGRA